MCICTSLTYFPFPLVFLSFFSFLPLTYPHLSLLWLFLPQLLAVMVGMGWRRMAIYLSSEV